MRAEFIRRMINGPGTDAFALNTVWCSMSHADFHAAAGRRGRLVWCDDTRRVHHLILTEKSRQNKT